MKAARGFLTLSVFVVTALHVRAEDNPLKFDEILQLRVDVENSANCNGSNADAQTVTSEAKLTGGQQDSCPYKLAITVEGSVETQDAPYDYVYINDVLYFSGNDDDGGCAMTTKTETKVVEVKSGDAVVLTYDTSDGAFHEGAYAKVTKVELVEESCEDGCAAGQGNTENGSLDLRLNLGKAKYGESIGALRISEATPSSVLGKPASLRYESGWPGVSVIRDAQNAIRQIKTPQILADVVTETVLRFRVDFYDAAQIGPLTGGLYSQSGKTPYVSWTIENLNGATNGQVRITRTGQGPAKVSDFTWNSTNQGWDLSTGNGLQKVSKAKTIDTAAQTTTITTEIRNQSNQLVSKERNTYKDFPWGREIIRAVADPDGAALATDYAYYENAASDGAAYSRIKSRIEASGSWVRYEYDSQGRLSKTVEPFLNAASTSAESACKVTTTTYEDYQPQETTIVQILGQEVERRYQATSDDIDHITKDVVCVQPGADYTDASNLVTETKLVSVGEFAGDTERTIYPDGTAEVFSYSSNAGTKTTAAEKGVWDGYSVTQGTRTTTTVDEAGNVLFESVEDIASGLPMSSKTTALSDSLGRPTQIDYANGTTELFEYGCCGLTSHTDTEGMATAYTYDALGRRETETRAGITLRHSYDAAGRLLKTEREAAGSATVTLSGASYDVAGRQTASENILGTSTVAETRNASGVLTRTETLPDAASTRVTTTARDGQQLSESGTAAYPRNFEYGITGGKRWTKEIKPGWQGALTEWTQTWLDAAGRPERVDFSDGSSTQTLYNNLDQIARTVDQRGTVTLFTYSPLGEAESTIIDVDNSGDESTADRITRTHREVTSAHATVVESVTMSEASDIGDVITAVVEQTPDGMKRWESLFGLPATETTVVVGATGNKTETAVQPDGSVIVRTYAQGRLTKAEHQKDTTVRRSKEYTYYPNGLPYQEIDGRAGTTITYSYNTKDLLSERVEGNLTTTYVYDALGNLQTETRPGSRVVQYTHLPTGEVQSVSGAEYPVTYVYDPQGRLKTLTTATGTTTWNCDAQRGWLNSKVDAANRSVSYTYWPDGRLRTRTNSRGIKTSYLYTVAGDLQKIDYADATPDVTMTYDRRGRLRTVTDAAGSHDLTVNAAGEIATDTISGTGLLAGVAATRAFDSLLRPSGFTASKGAQLAQSTSTYDSVSRLATVTSGARTATYDYHPKSALVYHVTFKNGGSTVATTTKQYDALDVLSSVSTAPAGGGAASSYSYVSTNGLRTEEVLPDGNTWVYGYNTRNELTNGAKHWGTATGPLVSGQQYGYQFDAIGNRQTATTNGQTSTYTANSLNQYTSRTVPGVVHVLGTSDATAAVTVNGATPIRENSGLYFDAALNVSNGSNPVQLAVNVTATKGADTSTVSGTIYVPKTPEAFTYDLDGNLISDGRWSYIWDAENRLIRMEATPAAVTAGAPHQRLNFDYDYLSRRIRKKVETWNGNGFTERSSTLFIYDGWKLAAEVLATGQKLRSYVWGSDISGGQDAGGIGGLLFIEQQPENKHFIPAFDGRGNVGALYDATSGAIGAQYEYAPFGELVRSSGAFAASNPIRLSSKYQDEEMNLIYYGYRYYNTETARWMSPDPVGERSGFNLYEGLQNNLTNLVDPDGREIVDNTKDLGVRPAKSNVYGETSVKFEYDSSVIQYDRDSKRYWLQLDGFVLEGSWWYAEKYPTKNATRLSSSPREHEKKHVSIYLEQGDKAQKKIESARMCEAVARCFKRKGLPKLVRAHYHDARWHSLGWDLDDYRNAALISSGVEAERSEPRRIADQLFSEVEQLLRECEAQH